MDASCSCASAVDSLGGWASESHQATYRMGDWPYGNVPACVSPRRSLFSIPCPSAVALKDTLASRMGRTSFQPFPCSIPAIHPIDHGRASASVRGRTTTPPLRTSTNGRSNRWFLPSNRRPRRRARMPGPGRDPLPQTANAAEPCSLRPHFGILEIPSHGEHPLKSGLPEARAMTVTIQVPPPLRSRCGGASELSLSAPSVRAALEQLERRHPALYR